VETANYIIVITNSRGFVLVAYSHVEFAIAA